MRCLYTALFDPPVADLDFPASFGPLLSRILILELKLNECLIRSVASALLEGDASRARELFSSCAAKLSEALLVFTEKPEQIISYLNAEVLEANLSRPLSEANLIRRMIHIQDALLVLKLDHPLIEQTTAQANHTVFLFTNRRLGVHLATHKNHAKELNDFLRSSSLNDKSSLEPQNNNPEIREFTSGGALMTNDKLLTHSPEDELEEEKKPFKVSRAASRIEELPGSLTLAPGPTEKAPLSACSPRPGTRPVIP